MFVKDLSNYAINNYNVILDFFKITFTGYRKFAGNLLLSLFVMLTRIKLLSLSILKWFLAP